MTITRHNIFPTPLLHIQGAPQQLVDKLYKKALELKQSYKDNGLRRSNQGGFQTTQINWEEFHPEGIEYINKIIPGLHTLKYTYSLAERKEIHAKIDAIILTLIDFKDEIYKQKSRAKRNNSHQLRRSFEC